MANCIEENKRRINRLDLINTEHCVAAGNVLTDVLREENICSKTKMNNFLQNMHLVQIT